MRDAALGIVLAALLLAVLTVWVVGFLVMVDTLL